MHSEGICESLEDNLHFLDQQLWSIQEHLPKFVCEIINQDIDEVTEVVDITEAHEKRVLVFNELSWTIE